ncbi:uncharacterized protein TNCV_516021 [Trichonephila clavipes]|nr:uncharacterized protein TNCV_516021 [Trichonephila clavipes]
MWRPSLSSDHDQMFSVKDRSGERADDQQSNTRHGKVHYEVGRRSWTRRKKRRGTIHVYSFVDGHRTVATRLYAVFSWEAAIMIAVSPNINALPVCELSLPDSKTMMWLHNSTECFFPARATIDLLKDTLGDRLISRFGPVNWPPRSCDLTPLDYFLWGYVKSLVYADKPQTLDHLEDHILRVIADIRPQMLEKVIENWTSRLDYIRASRDSPMPEIIFKM